MTQITFTPIGIIHTPFKTPEGAPIQPHRSGGAAGTVEVHSEFAEGLSDLDGFSHIILLYHLHLSKGYKLKVVPFLDDQERGLFATRAPRRPNPIGVSIVRLQRIEGNVLHIADIDMVDGTPLLDIKPHVPHFDTTDNFRIGWLTDKARHSPGTRADDRFQK
ncbi:MAG: tRNA (N6-threonylcarbamoyladenosine(37)-N6)-methyltransferase TrmO [candidate division Zixibacteria bacterium]|nr:tRNA (N6-threonylcarbamoyladenosine(37)-N6)-methyltransferase TrmO [candidate division Zixibacteria bacterium]